MDALQASIAEYEDEESIPPSDKVFKAVRAFLKTLEKLANDTNIEQPKIFRSPNGHLIVKFGTSSLQMNIRFKPGLSFVLQQEKTVCEKGDSADAAAALVFEHFQVL